MRYIDTYQLLGNKFGLFHTYIHTYLMPPIGLSYYNKEGMTVSTIRNANMVLCNTLCQLIYVEFIVKSSPGK